MIFFLVSVSAGMAQVSVSAKLENNKILIGDHAVFHVEAKYPDTEKVTHIDLSLLDSVFARPDAKNPDKDPGQLEVLGISQWDTLVHNSLVTLKTQIKLTAWKAGVYDINPIVFHFQKSNSVTYTRATNKIMLLVDSPLGDDIAADTVQLAPIKDIITEPLKFEDFLPFIIGLLVLAGLIWLGIFISKRSKNKGQPKEVVIQKRPAHEIALEQLEQLKDAQLWQKGMVKEYQSELSHIIREYVENRYETLALESTTDEILQDLKHIDFDESLKSNLKEMLQLADLVKFAKAEPPPEKHEQWMLFAEDFILKTKLQPVDENIVGGER